MTLTRLICALALAAGLVVFDDASARVRRPAAAAAPQRTAILATFPADFEARILAHHNAERRAVGVAPLAWDARLAADAATWARHLAATHRFEHAPDVPGRPPEGENLWMGTTVSYSLEEMVDSWIDERAMYRPGLFPDVTTTRDWADVGHYTQLIWYNTRRVGCALATGGGDDYLVCRYDPAGNWDGESPTGDRAKSLARRPAGS